jgi:hypothetical protein
MSHVHGLHDFHVDEWAFQHIKPLVPFGHTVEVTAESTPPEIPTTKPFTFAFSA